MVTLLLADDSVTIQRVIELTFADEGIRVVSVGDGASAIARINHECPDIGVGPCAGVAVDRRV
jgi:CheY-like chemotaxis protein